MFSSCSRRTGNSLERVAILPANVLISDVSAEWISVALPLVLQEDLATSRTILASAANGESAAYQSGASEVLHTTIENRNGRIRIEAVFTDLHTQRNRNVLEIDGPSPAGLVGSINRLAKRIDEHASDFSTNSERALQAFTGAAESTQLQARVQMVREAASIDPAFGLAYIMWLEMAAQSAPQAISGIMATAKNHVPSFTGLDRARFNTLAARLLHAPLPQQEASLRTLLQLAPNSVDALATLGSLRFLEGDPGSGGRLLGRALELSPGNTSIRQQLGQGLLEARRFSEAEQMFVGLDNNPASLPSLATCVLLEGDTTRADTIIERFIGSVANPDLKTLFRDTWLAVSGQSGKAIAGVQTSTFENPMLRSIALSQLAMWQLMGKDAAGARKSATEAVRLDPRSVSFAAAAMLVTEGGRSVNEWRQMVDVSPIASDQQAKESVLGYGFFLNGRYSEAAQVWQQALDRSGGADLRARTMLAASFDRAGKRDDPRKVLVEPFVPEFGDLYAAVSFAEMRRLLQLH